MVVLSLELDFLIYVPELFLFLMTALQGRYQHLHFTLEIEACPRPHIQYTAKQEFPPGSSHSQPPTSHKHRCLSVLDSLICEYLGLSPEISEVLSGSQILVSYS